MIDATTVLMLRGILGVCPDCAQECVLVPSDDFAGLCCTSCDAAVFPLEAELTDPLGGRDLLHRLAG